MANPRIQHKRGPNAPGGNSGITAGEFAIQLGTGPLGPVNVFVGVSGSNTPVRVGTTVVENFSITSNNNVPTSQAVANFVNTQFTAQVIGVCFMEGPAEGEGTIDIRQSLGGPGSGFSGFVGVTFQIACNKDTSPEENVGFSDEHGANFNHKILVGDINDGLNPKTLLLGELLGYIGHSGGDITVDQYGRASIVGIVGTTQGGLGFSTNGLTYGEVPVWNTNGWTAAKLLGGTGIDVFVSQYGGITLSLELTGVESGVYGNASTSPLQIPVFTVDETGRITVASDASISLYNVAGGFTGYVSPVFEQYFKSGSTFFEGKYISSDFTNNEIILTNTGITGISVNGTYYTGGIILSAGNGISVDVSGSNPETITITNLGAVGVSGNISLQGHTQGNVYLSNFTGSQNLVITKGGYGDGFDPATGRCGYAVFVGLSSGIQLPSNISAASNAFISIPTGFTGFGGFGGVCFGTQIVTGGTGGARGFLEVNRIEATGNNRITGLGAGSIAGTVLELDARGGTESGQTTNSVRNGRNAKIVLASYPSDQANLVTDITGSYNASALATGYQIGGPNRVNTLPGITLQTEVQTGTVRLYNNARVEKHMVVGGNLYVFGTYFDNTGATVDFVKIAAIANNNFAGTLGQNAFIYPTGATFGYGILSLGASGTSGHDVGILFNAKSGNSGPTAGFFGFDSSAQAFTLRLAGTTFGITYSSTGVLNLDTTGTIAAPLFVGAINGVTLGLHTGSTSASILLAAGHRLGLCGPYGLTFSVSANNTVTIPAESTSPQLTTLVTLTNTQTMTNKTLGADCIIDCGTY